MDGNQSVYTYNSHMKEMIYQWKYRGDYEVGFSFMQDINDAFRKLGTEKKTIVVPIPLSEERLAERGFNQALQLASFIPKKSALLLRRVHGEKQSKKTRRERITAENPFIIEEKVEKPVILVDDIYTTGATLHKAAAVLKRAGCPRVESLTLVRG
ncbi:ComF family protein [Aciduricibacillus chroicocephali]|uniref:ComF family protein n=1 Tax=Aciduricibacillus chroicocephali TaxID=3054939 RepID=A0ABY9KTD1_9BACI|nr:ComF family protein [Bacillaceae bacterium 44XB]